MARKQRGKGGLIRAFFILGLLGAMFVAAVIFGAGGREGLLRAPASLMAGPLEFEHPGSWGEMDEKRFPTVDRNVEIVAGRCPIASSESCTTEENVYSLVFSTRGDVPRFATLEQQLNTAINARYSRVRVFSSGVRSTRDGTLFLRFEFAHGKVKTRMRQVIAVYRVRSGTVVVVADGPAKQYLNNKEAINDVLVSAVEK